MLVRDTSVAIGVEGRLDQYVVEAVLRACGLTAGTVFGQRGKPYLKQRVLQWNHAAHRRPWVVVADLDRSYDCAPMLLQDWLPVPERLMCLRVAVRTIESWLLADHLNLASFLAVAVSNIPTDPENIGNPKQFLVNLARRSRKKAVRLAIVPEPGTGASVAPTYNEYLSEFVLRPKAGWDPRAAAKRSTSLRRCMTALRNFKTLPLP